MNAAALGLILGFTFPTWWKTGYDTPAAASSLAQLAQTGAGWVAFCPTGYVDGPSGSEIKITDGTPNDDSLRRTIAQAHGLGLKVVLKPHVDAMGSRRPRSTLLPSNRPAWFKSYRKFLAHYAAMAQAERVELFVVGTELFSLTTAIDAPWWHLLIADTRRAYSGPITYAANWYDFWKIDFWRKLDYIGIDGYFPIPGETPAAQKRSWLMYLPVLRAVAAATGKRVLFTEVGLSAQKGANLRPWDYGTFGRTDMHTQQLYFQSFLEVFDKERYFAGFLQWAWEPDTSSGGPNDPSMTVQGKPALDVLKDYFRRKKGFTRPPDPLMDLGPSRARIHRALNAVWASY